MVLVDGGYPGFMPLIEEAMQRHQLSLAQLTGIIITHHDIDHMGALFEIKAAYPNISVYSSPVEAAYISGKEKAARLVQAEEMQANLPKDQQEGALQFIAMLKGVQTVSVDSTFNNLEEPSFLPGVQIFYTPGHTPGHFSLYIKESKTFIAADAVVAENDYLEIANPQFALDLSEAVNSVKKIQQLDIDTLICYHGGVVKGDISNRLSQLVAKYTGE
jgi:glyoxylase-like metal-dependent hydrolase (beta-lactamase superfamily II)